MPLQLEQHTLQEQFEMGADPATSSTPFIATLVDVTGLLIYLGTAFLLLKEVLF